MAAWYGKDYGRLQQEIRGLSVEDVQFYDINYISNKVKSLPPELGRLVKLKTLRIYSAQGLEGLPHEIGKLKELEHLSVSYCNIKQLPNSIQKLEKLHTLELTGLRFDKTTDWSFLKKLKSLKSLNLKSSLSKLNNNFPTALFKINSLCHLDLSANNLTNISSELTQLQNLESLSILGNHFDGFPIVVVLLPKLSTLQINSNYLDSCPKELALLPKGLIIEVGKNDKKSLWAQIIIQIFQKERQLGFSKTFRSLLLNILKKGQTALTSLEDKTLLELLNCQIEHFEQGALVELTTRGQQKKYLTQHPIDKTSNVYVLGKVVAKRDLTRHLRTYGANIRRKFSAKITHIVIGKQAGADYKLLEKPNVVGVTEKMLIDHFNMIEKPYLIHNTDEADLNQNIENIRALLYNGNSENVELAFGLLSGGGFPKELLLDMLLVYKGNFKAKYRTKASKYIEQYGSADLLAGIKRRFSLWGYITPSTLAKTINFYGSFEDIDKVKLIDLLYQQGQRRVVGSVLEHFSSEKKTDFIRDCIKENTLDWSNTDLKELPEELALLKDEILELNLNNCYFANKFPKVILQLEKLEVLHICNKWWQKEKFPKEVLKMPKLKKIYISRKKINIPSAEELSAHNCELHIK